MEGRLLRRGENAAEIARQAAERGIAALGIAGGDGTLGAVAGVALEHELPFVPVPFGTRNHFARDVGFERDDPIAALAAFHGDERRVDVGTVASPAPPDASERGAARRIFLNNVSLGLYASLVHDPRRDTKNRLVALARMLPAGLGRSRRPLDVSVDIAGRRERHAALVVVVANNDYELRTMADLGERERLDEGLLHAYVIVAAARRTLVALLARVVAGTVAGAEGWTEWAVAAFRVESRRARIDAAVDGEPAVLRPPLEFAIEPRALRVLVPTSVDDGEHAVIHPPKRG